MFEALAADGNPTYDMVASESHRYDAIGMYLLVMLHASNHRECFLFAQSQRKILE